MDWLAQLFNWIGENESVLSGIAAVIAIGAVVVAVSHRTFGLFRTGRDGRPAPDTPADRIAQEIRYCRTADGHRIAWASAGAGYPLVRSLGWFTNLEMEWDSPVSSDFCQKLARRCRLIRYDGRGMGLSDRDVSEFTPETRLADLEAVVEASGMTRFALLGMSEGGSTAIRYAHRYPERVSHLILWGSFVRSPDTEDIPGIGEISRGVAQHWGKESPVFHQMFTAMFLPDGNAEENKLFNDIQRTSATAETASLFLRSLADVDIRDIAGKVEVPTLVLHRKGDLAIPVKYGKEIATTMPNARLVLLEGSNHWFVTADESMDEILRLIDEFLRN